MKNLRIIAALAILLILFLFGIYNGQSVQLALFTYQTPPMPLFLVLIFVFFLGIFLTALYYTWRLGQLRRHLANARKQVEKLSAERNALQEKAGAGSSRSE